MDKQKRLLFVGEGATLAHVVRPLSLASGIKGKGITIDFACDPRYRTMVENLVDRWIPLASEPSATFLNNIPRGRPVFSAKTLRQYVHDDLKVIEEVDPDLIVGDFRLSLSVSARLLRKPYATISNFHWSPHSNHTFPMPEVSITRYIGFKAASALFRLIQPTIFRLHSRPINQIRREFGLQPLDSLLEVYTDADYVLYTDVPEFYSGYSLPKGHHFIGAMTWCFDKPVPPWWDDLPADLPVAYVVLGSSGSTTLLPAIVEALSELPLYFILETGSNPYKGSLPSNARTVAYAPAKTACQRSNFVVTNGGISMCYIALSEGVPVLQIPSNLDQHLSARPVEKFGGGVTVRSEHATVSNIRTAATRLIDDRRYEESAKRIQKMIGMHDPNQAFSDIVESIFAKPSD